MPKEGKYAGLTPVSIIKTGDISVSKKLENAAVERSSKFAGKEKTSSAPVKVQNTSILLTDTFQNLRHTFPAAAAQGAYEKPRPTLKKLYCPNECALFSSHGNVKRVE